MCSSDLSVATSISRTVDSAGDLRVNVYFANFAGLKGGENPVQTPQSGVEVSMKTESGGKGFFLPFLGEEQEIKGTRSGDVVTFALPALAKGAVFSYVPAN